jgi:predicted ATPase
VALVTMRDGQVIIIDSPEGHLHPRAQSKMGKLLAHFAAAGLQVLVESHSDHVVSGIRLAVKAKMLAPEQVAIHFFQGRNAVGSGQIVSPALDAEGSIEAWPDGFFDQFEKDLADLSGWT